MIEDVVKHLRAAVRTDPDKYQIVLTHGEAEEILAWMDVSVRDESRPGGICHMGHDWGLREGVKCMRCGVGRANGSDSG
jgi:hypothetical protein